MLKQYFEFDTTILKPGIAIEVTTKDTKETIVYEGVIVHSSSTKLTVVRHNPEQEEGAPIYATSTISIHELAENLPMKEYLKRTTIAILNKERTISNDFESLLAQKSMTALQFMIDHRLLELKDILVMVFETYDEDFIEEVYRILKGGR